MYSFWLHWLSDAAHGIFAVTWELPLWHSGLWLWYGLGSTGSGTLQHVGVLVPQTGIEPTFPALQSGYVATGLPGKSRYVFLVLATKGFGTDRQIMKRCLFPTEIHLRQNWKLVKSMHFLTPQDHAHSTELSFHISHFPGDPVWHLGWVKLREFMLPGRFVSHSFPLITVAALWSGRHSGTAMSALRNLYSDYATNISECPRSTQSTW